MNDFISITNKKRIKLAYHPYDFDEVYYENGETVLKEFGMSHMDKCSYITIPTTKEEHNKFVDKLTKIKNEK